MRLLVYSYFPVLADSHNGGAQHTMHNLLSGFIRAGLDVKVLCPEYRGDNLLNLGERLRIMPVLKGVANRPLFPYERFYNIQRMAEALEDADVVWALDQSFPLITRQPIVLTLGNFSYAME